MDEHIEAGGITVPPFLRQLFVVSGVVLYMAGTGANIAYPAVLLPQLQERASSIQLSPEDESWIASILGLALVNGILLAPFSLERLGRRRSNQLSTLPALAGWALMCSANGSAALLAGRYLTGLAMGLQAPAGPVTIAEYSAPRYRGAFLATIAFAFGSGMLAAHIAGVLWPWRIAALACATFNAASLFITTFSPETPSWLASHAHYEKSKQSFRWLRGVTEESEKELHIMIDAVRNRSKLEKVKIDHQKARWRVFLEITTKKEFYKPTLIMTFLFTIFQFSGMTVIPSYTVPVMKAVTADSMDPHTAMLAVDLVRFVTAILSCIVVNKFNRRSVLFFSSTVSVISLLVTSTFLYLTSNGYLGVEYTWVPITSNFVYIFGKTIGILPIPWAIAGEVFPLAYRSLGSGVAGLVLSIMFFAAVKTAPAMFLTIGVHGAFLVYAIIVTFCTSCLYFIMPETKGKTLHEIEYFFTAEKPSNVIAEDFEKDKMLVNAEKIEAG